MCDDLSDCPILPYPVFEPSQFVVPRLPVAGNCRSHGRPYDIDHHLFVAIGGLIGDDCQPGMDRHSLDSEMA